MLNWQMLNLQTLFLIIGVIAVLKLYFRGTKCSIRRDLTGKVALITGGNTGIGKQTMLDLVRNGCTVIMGARDTIKCQLAVKEAIKETKNGLVEHFYLDLASKASIQDFVRDVTAKYKSIDYLINNAGVMFIPKRTLTTDGFEMHMGINHFGHFYLTSLLWPYLKDSKDLKIINVSSLVHAHTVLLKAVSIDFEDLNFEKGYDPYLAYSKSKLCNILFTKELSKRIQKINSNARVVCLHPGVVRTEIMRYVKKGIIDFLYMLIEPIYWVFSKNSKEGAQTTLYTIYETNDKLLNGGYYSECKLKGVSSEASKVQSPGRLWDLTEKTIGAKFDI